MAPLLTRLQDCGWTSADVPEIKDKKASITLRDSVDLSLSYSPENLCSAFISEYQRSLGLQPGIITLLNASWLVTVRCFCPVQDIHLGLHSPGVYFIARLPHRAHRQVAIDLNCEAPVRNLVRDVSLLQSEATSHMSLGDDVSNEAPEKFLTTTISYAEELSALTGRSSNGDLNKEVNISRSINRRHTLCTSDPLTGPRSDSPSIPNSSCASLRQMANFTPSSPSPSLTFPETLHLVCCIHSIEPSGLCFRLHYNP